MTCETTIQLGGVEIDLNKLKGFMDDPVAESAAILLHFKNGEQQSLAISKTDFINELQQQTNLIIVNMGRIYRVAPPIGDSAALKPPRKIPNHLLAIFRPSMTAVHKTPQLLT